MRILVCGGRNYRDSKVAFAVLDELAPRMTALACGGATGADQLAKAWAAWADFDITVYKAEWEKYRLAAGPYRNERMLQDFKPDLVVAFPGGKGTAHMVRIAKAAGVAVREVK
jgi:hypothetical protein